MTKNSRKYLQLMVGKKQPAQKSLSWQRHKLTKKSELLKEPSKLHKKEKEPSVPRKKKSHRIIVLLKRANSINCFNYVDVLED